MVILSSSDNLLATTQSFLYHAAFRISSFTPPLENAIMACPYNAAFFTRKQTVAYDKETKGLLNNKSPAQASQSGA